MDQPQRTRVALSAAAAVVIAAIFATVLITGKRPPAAPQAPSPKVEPSVQPVAEPPPPPELRRGDLAEAAARAASAYAAGLPYPEDNKALAGRRFEAVIPFGCNGPGPDVVNPAQWTIDKRRSAITLRAEPQDWTETAWVRDATGAGEGERIEGFWLPRPWIMAESCPVVRLPPDAAPTTVAGKGEAAKGPAPAPAAKPDDAKVEPAPAEQTLGLVSVFATDSSRVGQRRSRPYQVVRKLDEPAIAAGPHEFHLVLRGRIVPLASGETIVCHADAAERRPACLIAATVDEVAIRDPATGEELAKWTN